MRKYEDVEREIVKLRECVKMVCDLCGREAEDPYNGLFEWGGAGTAVGKLERSWFMDGESCTWTSDLCYECAERVARAIERKQIP